MLTFNFDFDFDFNFDLHLTAKNLCPNLQNPPLPSKLSGYAPGKVCRKPQKTGNCENIDNCGISSIEILV